MMKSKVVDGAESVPSVCDQQKFYNDRWTEVEGLTPLMVARRDAILGIMKRISRPELSVLDLGCGRGWLAYSLSEYGSVTAIDLSSKGIKKAQGLYSGVNFIAGNFFDTPIPNSPFDVVVSQEVIEHVADHRTYAELAASMLKPRGVLILTTPHKPVAEPTYTRRSEDEGHDVRQPLENLLSCDALRDVLDPEFDILELKTIIFGYDHRSILRRLLNSWKFGRVCQKLGCLPIIDRFRSRMQMGLHILCVAKLR